MDTIKELKITIRTVNHSDVEKVNILDNEMFGSHAFPIDYFVQGIDVFGDGLFLAENNNQVLGYGIAAIDANKQTIGHILSVAVKEAYRKKHIGLALTNQAILHLVKLGANEIRLTVDPENIAAINLYKNLNFKDTQFHENHFGPGYDRQLMALKI